MGRASREKRERREGGGGDLQSRAAKAVRDESRRPRLPLFWIAVAVVVVAVIGGLVVTANDEDASSAKKIGEQAPVFADVEVAGESLTDFPGNERDDPAVGDAIPTISGTSLEDEPMTIGADDGAQVIVAVAHWCPHCQAEVPRIVEWAEDGGLPEGVSITTVSTSVSESQPNFPPAEWLAKEDWSYPVLVDDEAGTAAQALGLEGFPFITFVRADGTVSERYAGEMPIKDFAKSVDELA